MFNTDSVMRRLHACVLAKVPVCLWAPPGAGKTARILAYAKARGLHCERWLLSRCEPIDLKPRVYDGGRIIVTDPPEIARLAANGGGLLFLDELNRASRETEGAALDRIDSPPPGVAVIAACNPQTKGQASRNLESAAANRFCHLTVTVDAAAYAKAQMSGWQQDDSMYPSLDSEVWSAVREANELKAAALIAGWITKRQDSLEREPDNAVQAGKAWPSARTWEYARNLFAVASTLELDADDKCALIAGCVGDGNALEFMQFAEDAQQLPDPETILAAPEIFRPIKDRVDITIVALASVAAAVDHNPTNNRWRAAWQVADICMKSAQADAAMVFGDMLICNYRKWPRNVTSKMTPPAEVLPKRMIMLLTSKK